MATILGKGKEIVPVIGFMRLSGCITGYFCHSNLNMTAIFGSKHS